MTVTIDIPGLTQAEWDRLSATVRADVLAAGQDGLEAAVSRALGVTA